MLQWIIALAIFTAIVVVGVATIKNKYHITQIGEDFYVCKQLYVLGISWSYEYIGETGDQEVPFKTYKECRRKMKQIKRAEKQTIKIE